MRIGPCMCGDTECPSCGRAQGTYTGPEPGDSPEDTEPPDEPDWWTEKEVKDMLP